MTVPIRLSRARAFVEARSWAEAFAAFEAADAAAPLSAHDLWAMSFAALLTGKLEAGFAGLERIYLAELEARPDAAARAAFWLGFRLVNMGETSRGNGWLARATKAAERVGEPCVEQGYLLICRARERFYAGDQAAALEAATRAAEVADHFGDLDLASFARNIQGRSRIRMGDVGAGLELLDEVMLSVTRDELSVTITGLIYCSAIDSCHGVSDVSRMREWTASLKRWCDEQPQLCSFTGECLIHRSEIMELAGDWPAALEEARRATQNMRDHYGDRATGKALYRQGEVLRLLGEEARAEERYRESSLAGRDPQPGLSLLRLAQGRCEAAAQGLRRALASVTEPIARTELLRAGVEIALAVDSSDEARAFAEELSSHAARFATPMLVAYAHDARGRVELAAGEAQAALVELQRAFEIFQQLDVPYHAARARVQIACTCRALDDEDGVHLAIDAARATFVRLGAAADLARIEALVAATDDPPTPRGVIPGDLSARELEVLRLVTSGKTNKRIAADLCLSEKTVDRHVSNILAKLAVPSRAAATAFAYENKLI